ncbi:MAG: F0F1-type ATP synthase assembly protein I [Crocinitomicaceae bacterium]|jgi:F0F1-type ATP synthase assembly protein I
MSDEKKPSGPPRYVRLSGIGAQMAATIFLGAILGRYLDDTYPSDKKWFTIGITLFAVAISLYNVLRQVNKLNSKDD